MVRGGFRVKVRVGDSFRVRVRDRVSFRAKGWVGFMYYGPKLFELNSLWRRIRKVKQNCAENHSFFPNNQPRNPGFQTLCNLCCYLAYITNHELSHVHSNRLSTPMYHFESERENFTLNMGDLEISRVSSPSLGRKSSTRNTTKKTRHK